MAKIVVDKNELKTIRDNINSLLESGTQNFPILTQQPIYESYELNGKEQLVIDYLNKKPAQTKEQVVEGLSKYYSRMTVLKTITELSEKGVIISRQDKVKNRTYSLYVNYQNIAISLKHDLELFKHFYSELLDHARPVIAELLKEGANESGTKMDNLLKALIGPYKYLCIMYIMSDLFLWNKRPLDDDTLHRKFAILFQTIKKLHIELVKTIPHRESELISGQLLFDSSYGFYESDILHILETFEEYGLSNDAEAVIDVLWKISYPILPMIYPSYYEKYFRNGTLKDWRKLLQNKPQPKYKPKTEILPFDK